MDAASTYIDFTSFINSVSLSLDLAESCALKDKNKKVDFDVPVPGLNVYRHNFENHS